MYAWHVYYVGWPSDGCCIRFTLKIHESFCEIVVVAVMGLPCSQQEEFIQMCITPSL